MKTIEASEASPTIIGLKFIVFLVLAMLLCVWIAGTETILMAAMASKPYSVLLTDYHFFGLITEYQESGAPEATGAKKVICLGDSNSFYPPDHVVPRDTNRGLHLSGMLYESIENSRNEPPRIRFSEWSYVGATLFDHYCLFYEAEKFSPDLIIVAINWFSFGPAWLDHHEYFRLELSALAPLRSPLPDDYEDPIRSENISAVKQLQYKADIYSLFPVGAKFWISDGLRSFFEPRARHEVSSPSEDPTARDADAGPVGNERVHELPKRGEFKPVWEAAPEYFPMSVERSNPTLRDMRALAYIASERDIKLLFFIWPIDIEYLEEVGAMDRSELMRARQFVKEEVVRENVYFADFADMLGHEYFYDMRGHNTPEGRKKVAEALYPTVLEILEEDSR